ncbi:MAG: hypothetical protein K2W82_01190 [Candidatus Obscuribacterales bacterium]|nr:hypothetical protein [Candidatus Obscuribacterales bacterium]
MSVTQDELMFLQSQLEGLESIFLELIPFGVELKRQQVQDYYEKRLDQATRPTANVAENELKRQFNTKANNVRNLVDSAESLGDASNKLNLIRAAASLPEQKSKALSKNVSAICQQVLYENSLDQTELDQVLGQDLGPVEARVLLGSLMFLIVDELQTNGNKVLVKDILFRLIQHVNQSGLLSRNDPFLIEAQCALEAMSDELN